jgi:hypothetical protein
MNRINNEQVNNYLQKIVVEFGEQSLTYNELIFHAQQIAMFLLENYNLTSGNIVYRCIENNLSMVSEYKIK